MNKPELRSLESVVLELGQIFGREAIEGVEGYRIAIRTKKGNRMIMEWGWSGTAIPSPGKIRGRVEAAAKRAAQKK